MGQTTPTRSHLFEIERERRWRVWLLFALLLIMVCVAIWVACLIVSLCLFLMVPVAALYGWVFSLPNVGLVFAVALLVSVVYWSVSRIGARARLLRVMRCVPLDPSDSYHHRLANIVEEMRLATGGPPIDCYVVHTLGLNAFSFSDLRGGGVIGVTEGALARLSRQQLQAVVAHEFGHILSGSYVTVTVSCLLFGIYSDLGERAEEAVFASIGPRAVPVVLAAASLRGLLWVLQLASSVTDAAMSRERERLADLAAADYTRDPLSLAEALRIIELHPGGAGHVPEGLAPLCIRDTHGRAGALLGRVRQTHPPLEERIDALLTLAAVPRDQFERQVEQARDIFAGREHWKDARVEASPAVPGRVSSAAGPHSCASSCPSCGSLLRDCDYEGATIKVCDGCGGRLARSDAVRRILARREVGFDQEQLALAELVALTGDRRRQAVRRERPSAEVPLVSCPSCGRRMIHTHFNYDHALEVDRCTICDLIWFCKDELEALQILTERQID